MADAAFNIGVAFGVQSARGVINATIDAMKGGTSFGLSDGIVLGDRDSGIYNSGIDTPTFERKLREVADVPGSFTKQASTFLETLVEGFSFTWQLKGNGASSTPSSGQAQPDVGINALLEGSGLVGAAGTSPVYEYTSATTTKYLSAHLRVGELEFVFKDILVDTLTLTPTPGGIVLAQATMAVGSLDFQNSGVTFPTYTFGTMATTEAPLVVGVANTWSTVRGFNSCSITISNDIEDVEDSNEATGFRKSPTGRTFEAEEAIWVDTVAALYELERLQGTASAAKFFQVGAVAGVGNPLVGFEARFTGPECRSVKHEDRDNYINATVNYVGVSGSAQGEFLLTFN